MEMCGGSIKSSNTDFTSSQLFSPGLFQTTSASFEGAAALAATAILVLDGSIQANLHCNSADVVDLEMCPSSSSINSNNSGNSNSNNSNHGLLGNNNNNNNSSNVSEKYPSVLLHNINTSGMRIFIALAAWYILGVLSVVTTKVLLTEWQIPPLLLTLQQLLLGCTILRTYLAVTTDHGVEYWSWPWNDKKENITTTKDLVLVGLFNALDFLASNTAFSQSAASFVETIKASDPITTSMVALIWGVDHVSRAEAANLTLLIAGMFLSTLGNAQTSTDLTFHESASIAATVVTANICFAFRAMSQKLYRRHAVSPMTDANLLCCMQQTGSVMLMLPACFCYSTEIVAAIVEPSIDTQLQYTKLALLNTFAFVTYNLAGCYVLSKVTVLHYAALSCLRRMFAIVASCIFFQVPITLAGACGILISFSGFCGFTHHRSTRRRKEDGKTIS